MWEVALGTILLMLAKWSYSSVSIFGIFDTASCLFLSRIFAYIWVVATLR